MEKKQYSNTVFFVSGVFSVLVSFFASFAMYYHYVEFVKKSYQDILIRTANMIEAQCPELKNPQRLRTLLGDDSDEYWEIQETFDHLQESMGVSYIYVLERYNGVWRFLLSSLYDRGTPTSVILTPHTGYSTDKGLNRAWDEKIQTYHEAKDQWGEFMTISRPVIHDGKTVLLCLPAPTVKQIVRKQ